MTAYVYLLRCADNSLYCGWTNNLGKRITAHNAGKGAKYTRSRLPVKLVWCQVFTSKSAALKMEHQIKQWRKQLKEDLVKFVGQV